MTRKTTVKAKRSPKKKKKTAIVVHEEREALPIELSQEIITDPRKALFLRLYFDRESPTWGNMKQTALASGFSDDYAHSITSLKPKWLYDFIRQQDFVDLAETHLREVLMLPNIVQAMGAFGPLFKTEIIKVQKKYKNGKTRMINKKVKTPVMVPNPAIIKEKTAASKVVLPAYDSKYKEREGAKNAFIFNIQAARDRYNGNKDVKVSRNH